MIQKRAEAASKRFQWNSLWMNPDAIAESTADRLGVSKADLLDPTSSDAAVKQAIAETNVIQETKAYFAAQGVNMDAFKSLRREDTTILVKNFPYGTTIAELRTMFEAHGAVLKVLMPPSGTIAIVQFTDTKQARTAFTKLAYTFIKGSMLFLEKGPKDLFKNAKLPQDNEDSANGVAKTSTSELLDGQGEDDAALTSTLFIRNLNFATTNDQLTANFRVLEGFVKARVKYRPDPKKPGQLLSMGYGFADFRTKENASAALQSMDGYSLDGHVLSVKPSQKVLDPAEERKREDQAKKLAANKTKLVIRNVPFEVSKKDIRSLLGTYGELRAVRLPKKFGNRTRGFAFAEFATPREAENCFNALKDTHLLGRRLALEWADAEAIDAEKEIEKMQKKIGGQFNRMALQQLTGEGRKKVNIGNGDANAE
jgi:multiple RNA-binding domain-containing protein 1